MGKRAKYHGSLDNLPDSILCHILSFLPTKDAVRTSILSPRWRYLFTSSISKLDFRDCLPLFEVPKEHILNFKKFVDRLFFNPNLLSLECFRVSSLDGDLLSVYNWLCAALWRGVKEIDVYLWDGAFQELPTLLFTCPSLVTLKLSICQTEMKLPTNLCLPNLRTLHLSGMEFVHGCSFDGLISGCPVLEEFDVYNCLLNGASELNIRSLSLRRLDLDFVYLSERNKDFSCVIDAPNLVYFKYFCLEGRAYVSRKMESLEKADITVYLHDDVHRELCVVLLQSIYNVQVLNLAISYHNESLFRMPLDPVLAFHILVELEFMSTFKDNGRPVSVTWIVEFLHCALNLNTLTMDLSNAFIVFESLREEVPSCLISHLKKINILYLEEDPKMFELVGYFLIHTSVLEKLVMRSIDVEYKRWRKFHSSVMKKLSSLPRNPRNAASLYVSISHSLFCFVWSYLGW